jgi:hypothetical protein
MELVLLEFKVPTVLSRGRVRLASQARTLYLSRISYPAAGPQGPPKRGVHHDQRAEDQ